MTNPSVFLDTSFLISTQIQVHDFHPIAVRLLKRFENSPKLILATHPIVFDEFWYVLLGIWRERGLASGVDRRKGLTLATDNIFNFQNFKLLNISLYKKDLLENIDLMAKFKLRPRDSLIVTIMKKAGIKKIVSFDKDFDRVEGIARVSA